MSGCALSYARASAYRVRVSAIIRTAADFLPSFFLPSLLLLLLRLLLPSRRALFLPLTAAFVDRRCARASFNFSTDLPRISR